MASNGQHNKRNAANMRSSRILKIFIVCICLFVAFVLGFFVRGNEPILSRLGFSSLVVSADQNTAAAANNNTYNSLAARVSEVDGIVTGDSLDSYDLDDTTTSVLDAYSASTDDKYLRYYNPARYSAYIKESAGKYAGIGALFSEYDGKAYVVDVFERSAAEAAGVKQGDFVVAIDGDRSQSWSTAEVINALSRDEGETAIVTWRRPANLEAEGGNEFTTTLVCSSLTTSNVDTEFEDGVGYITLRQFTQNSSALVEDAIKSLDEQGAGAFVLDIRDNPGGYLTQAVDVASLFIKSGVIVEIETKEGASPKSATGKTATDKPLVIIVNGNTAAAAEVLAAALQDSGRASVVGVNTMGKGSVQVTKSLTFGGALRYTAALYKTPLGRNIQGSGVSPDIVITQSDSGQADNQKDFALESAQFLIPG